MAPKRHKKQKAKQVRHHLATTRTIDREPAEDLEADVVEQDGDRVEADQVQEERSPALDIWPDFEEVVFPTPMESPSSAAAQTVRQVVVVEPEPESAAELEPQPSAHDNGDGVLLDARELSSAVEHETAVERPADDSEVDLVVPAVERRRSARPAADEAMAADDTEAELVEDATDDESLLGGLTRRLRGYAHRAPLGDDLDEDERAAAPTYVTTAPSIPVERVDDPLASDEHDAPQPTTSNVDDRAVHGVDGRVPGGRFLDRFREAETTHPLRVSEVLAMLGAIALAITLWVPMMRRVRLKNMDDLGLISALPAATVIPFALLIASFAYCLWRAKTKTLLLAIHTVALVVMVYAIRALYVPVPSFKVTYRHIGVADTIARSGTVDSTIDAYFNWPGFFTYAEGLAKAAGFQTIEAFANLAPLAFNLLYLAPLLVIMRLITRDQRIIWVGIWTFYLGNWVAQDYLSPQGLAYFLHLVVIAVVLRWFTRGRGKGAPVPSGPILAGLATVLILMAYMIPSHQLTPFATIFALFAVLASRRLSTRALPIIVAIMAATWLVLMATNYLSGHQNNVTGSIGAVDSTVSSNVASRVTGTAQRVFVNQTRIFFSLGIWLLAIIGAIRLFIRRKLDPVHVLVPVSAFLLIPLQSYGGEVVFRVFLFVLPFVAAFATIALLPRAGGRFSRLMPIMSAVWLSLLLGTFVIIRYGNERMDTFTADEISATQYLYNAPGVATAKRRSVLALGGSDNLPWKAREYDTFQWKTMTDLEEWKRSALSGTIATGAVVKASRELMRHYPDGAYLIFTRSQAAEIDLTGASPRGSLQRVEVAVARSPMFRRVYSNGNASIYVLTEAGKLKDGATKGKS